MKRQTMTATSAMTATILSVGQVAQHFGCRRWHIQRVFEDGLLPEVGKIGNSRAIPASLLPAIEEALRQRGYIK